MKFKVVLVIIIMLISNVKIFSQDEVFTPEKAEALFIYNFSRHIGWPESSFNSDEFVIGVVGDKLLFHEISKITKDKQVGKNKIVVKYFASSDEVVNSHMLVIGDKFRNNIELYKSKLSSFPTLFINSGNNNSVNNTCISFKQVDQKMSYILSRNNIKNKGLIMSKRLEEMALAVE